MAKPHNLREVEDWDRVPWSLGECFEESLVKDAYVTYRVYKLLWLVYELDVIFESVILTMPQLVEDSFTEVYDELTFKLRSLKACVICWLLCFCKSDHSSDDGELFE